MKALILYTRLLPVVLLSVFLISCSEKESINISLKGTSAESKDSQQPRIYSFGFDPRSSPQEDARQYLPFLKYLESATGYRFQLRFTQKGADITDTLGRGELDFAALGATSYIHARETHNYAITPIARGVNMQGKDVYRSYYIVHPNSDISDISQLSGRHMAFGSKTSTQGHLIPRIIMQQHGITLAQLSSYKYTGSHLNCANAVVAGHAEICGMQDTMAEDMAKQGLIKILFRSDYYPSSGIVANNKVNKQAIEKVRQALLAFQPMGKHSSTLYNWHKTEMPRGFVQARQEDYIELKQWMLKLGFLKPQAGS